MNNSHFFVNPLNTIQLVSMFSHINTLSDLLYTQNLLAKNDQFKPIPTVNSLYEYFDKNNDDIETKTNLVHKLLSGSDLYGANKNETIDSEYVNAMFDYIIGNIVFTKYGNIYGFLSETIMSTDNVTLSVFKEQVKNNLRIANYTNEDVSISHLSNLAVRKITEELIFPLFPQAENNVRVVSPDYIYAQAGLTFARAAKMDLNITFDELIEISQTIELSVHADQINSAVLSIFAIPAALYYFHTEKNFLKEEVTANIVTDSEFWVAAYEHLFTNLHSTYEELQKTLRTAEEENPTYQFKVAMSHYKTRTQLAEENIRIHCPLENEDDYKSAIDNYKYKQVYYCEQEDFNKRVKKITLPNVNDIFDEQNEEIKHEFFSMKMKLIKDAFGQHPINVINCLSIIIYQSQAAYTAIAFGHGIASFIYTQTVNKNVDLIEIYVVSTGKSVHHALIHEDDKIVWINEEDQDDFCEKIGLKKGSQFERIYRILKHSTETFDTFASRIAEKRADDLKNMLHNKGYEETNWELSIKILLSFVPFYNCVNNLIQGKNTEAVLDCSLDAVTLIPVYGAVISTGAKIISKSLLLTLGTSIRTLAFRESIFLSLRTIGKGVLSHAATEFSLILSKQTFKTIGISIIRASDPGFEFLGRLDISGIKSTLRLLSLIGKRLPSSLYNKITKSLEKLTDAVKSIKIGKFHGEIVQVKTLSGTNGYGHKYFSVSNEEVELRRVLGHRDEVAVKVERVTNSGQKIYKMFNLETGKTFGSDLNLRNDILQIVIPPLRIRLQNILLTGLSGKGAIVLSRATRALVKEKLLKEAVNILNEKVAEEQVQKTLKQYVLEEVGKTEVDFAKYWRENSQLPSWSKELKLPEASENLYWELRYKPSLDEPQIEIELAKKRITELYKKDLENMDTFSNIDTLTQYYNKRGLAGEISFEDFYAIKNYMDSGFMKIMEETAPAKRMQNALYKLALRQADGSLQAFPKKFYRGETRDRDVANSFVVGEKIELSRFTSVSISEGIAIKFAKIGKESPGQISLIYELNLDHSYLTANLYKLFPENFEKEFVILPQVSLYIKEVDIMEIKGSVVKRLIVENLPVNKCQWLIKIVEKIIGLQNAKYQLYYKPT